MARQRFQAGIGGTLRLAVLNVASQPTSASVTIKASTGQELPTPVAGAAAIIRPIPSTLSAPEGAELSYLLSGAQCPAPTVVGGSLDLAEGAEPPPGYGHSYRAVWDYVIAGQAYQADQLYEVRLRLLRPTLTADQVQRQLPAQWEDLVAGGADEITAILADAWDDLLDEVEAQGFDPDRIMDSGRLHKPHRSLVIWMLARTWGPAWREWTDDRAKDYGRDLGAALDSGGWYDTSGDAIQAPTEQKWASIRLTR